MKWQIRLNKRVLRQGCSLSPSYFGKIVAIDDVKDLVSEGNTHPRTVTEPNINLNQPNQTKTHLT